MKPFAAAFIGVALAVIQGAPVRAIQEAPPGSFPNRWTIPDGAAAQPNPLPLTPAVLEKGKALYAAHCLRCHGAAGKNDGPASDADQVNADLTDDYRTSINPDGVVFYKIWYGFGRMGLRMPRFDHTLSQDDVWAVVAYVQTLRAHH